MTTTFATIILIGIILHAYTACLIPCKENCKRRNLLNRISWLALAVSTTFAFLLLFV